MVRLYAFAAATVASHIATTLAATLPADTNTTSLSESGLNSRTAVSNNGTLLAREARDSKVAASTFKAPRRPNDSAKTESPTKNRGEPAQEDAQRPDGSAPPDSAYVDYLKQLAENHDAQEQHDESACGTDSGTDVNDQDDEQTVDEVTDNLDDMEENGQTVLPENALPSKTRPSRPTYKPIPHCPPPEKKKPKKIHFEDFPPEWTPKELEKPCDPYDQRGKCWIGDHLRPPEREYLFPLDPVWEFISEEHSGSSDRIADETRRMLQKGASMYEEIMTNQTDSVPVPGTPDLPLEPPRPEPLTAETRKKNFFWSKTQAHTYGNSWNEFFEEDDERKSSKRGLLQPVVEPGKHVVGTAKGIVMPGAEKKKKPGVNKWPLQIEGADKIPSDAEGHSAPTRPGKPPTHPGGTQKEHEDAYRKRKFQNPPQTEAEYNDRNWCWLRCVNNVWSNIWFPMVLEAGGNWATEEFMDEMRRRVDSGKWGSCVMHDIEVTYWNNQGWGDRTLEIRTFTRAPDYQPHRACKWTSIVLGSALEVMKKFNTGPERRTLYVHNCFVENLDREDWRWFGVPYEQVYSDSGYDDAVRFGGLTPQGAP